VQIATGAAGGAEQVVSVQSSSSAFGASMNAVGLSAIRGLMARASSLFGRVVDGVGMLREVTDAGGGVVCERDGDPWQSVQQLVSRRRHRGDVAIENASVDQRR